MQLRYLLELPREGSTERERGVSEAVLGTPPALLCANMARSGCQHPRQDGPIHPPPPSCEGDEAAGSDMAGRKATASQEGTEPRRHRIPSPKSTLYSTTAFREDIRKAARGVRLGEKRGEGGRFLLLFLYIYI